MKSEKISKVIDLKNFKQNKADNELPLIRTKTDNIIEKHKQNSNIRKSGTLNPNKLTIYTKEKTFDNSPIKDDSVSDKDSSDDTVEDDPSKIKKMFKKLDKIIQNKYKFNPNFKESKITVQYVNYEMLQIGEGE